MRSGWPSRGKCWCKPPRPSDERADSQAAARSCDRYRGRRGGRDVGRQANSALRFADHRAHWVSRLRFTAWPGALRGAGGRAARARVRRGSHHRHRAPTESRPEWRSVSGHGRGVAPSRSYRHRHIQHARTRRGPQATQTVPIVAAGPHRDLQDLGLVDNLARPGRNVTGLLPHPGLDTKGVELLAQTIPGLEQVGYLFNPATSGVLAQVGRARKGAEELGVEFLELPARVPDDIDAQFEAATMAGVGGLIVSTDFLFGDPSGWRVVPLALRFRLPTIYKQTDGYVDQGGLMAYTSDYKAFHRRAATFVDKLLHGANAADLPVEQTTTFDFVINLKTAEAMNLTIPRN